MSSRQKKGKRTKKTKKGPRQGQAPSRSDSRAPGIVQTNPAAIGMILPRASFSRGGTVQKMADQDFSSSERITGCDLLTPTVNAIGTTGVISFSPTPVTGAQWTPLTPSLISARLGAIEEMFQWYAIRDIKIRYVPNCGSTTPGSVAMGVTTDKYIATVAIASPTQQQILEFNPASLVPVWGSTVMESKFRGSKLFECFGAGASVEEYQCVLGVSGTGPTTATVLGQIWVDYVIDFYQQTPLLSSVDLFKRGLPCPRCRQSVLVNPSLSREEKVKAVDRDDEFVILRTKEPSTGVFQGLQTYQGLESPPIRREESKAQMTTRSQSQKG